MGGQLHQLIEKETTSLGNNIFHRMGHDVKPAQLQTLLRAMTKANGSPLTPGCALPGDICAIIRSFLPSPILDHQNKRGQTPLVYTGPWGRTALDLARERAYAYDAEPGHGRNRRSRPSPELISYLEAVTTPALAAAAALSVAVSEDSSRSSNPLTSCSSSSPEY